MLDLVEAVEINMRGCDEVKIMVAARILKSSQLAGDRGSVVSRIIEIESKSKIDFEYIHVNNKKVENNEIVNK